MEATFTCPSLTLVNLIMALFWAPESAPGVAPLTTEPNDCVPVSDAPAPGTQKLFTRYNTKENSLNFMLRLEFYLIFGVSTCKMKCTGVRYESKWTNSEMSNRCENNGQITRSYSHHRLFQELHPAYICMIIIKTLSQPNAHLCVPANVSVKHYSFTFMPKFVITRALHLGLVYNNVYASSLNKKNS